MAVEAGIKAETNNGDQSSLSAWTDGRIICRLESEAQSALGVLLLYHRQPPTPPPVELPHSRETLICTQTIKSAGLETDIILPRARSCTLGNLLCCLMELMRWHTYSVSAILPKPPHPPSLYRGLRFLPCCRRYDTAPKMILQVKPLA